jgi:uncharacterized protein (TIGR03435 family)
MRFPLTVPAAVPHCLILAALLLSPCCMKAQSASTPPPEFEVATVKPVDMSPGVMHLIGTKVEPGGRVVITSFPLKGLICTAFGLEYWQLTGGEEWMNKQYYDIEAQPPHTDPPTNYNVRHTNQGIEDPQLRKMLQALLIARFNLKFHTATTKGMVYLLEKSGKAVPMTATSPESSAKMYSQGYSDEVGFAGNRWGIYNSSMPELARYASGFLHKPVEDRTGIDGAFTFRWTVLNADEHAGGEEFMNTYYQTFPLFLDAMGLKLTKSTGDIQTFVIDHAEPPSPN